MVVSDIGSVWNLFGAEIGIAVGRDGSGNRLVICNGGQVLGGTWRIGSGGGNSNSVLVTGTGSVWSNSSRLAIGNSGTSNSMVISDGGKVIDNDGILGNSSNSVLLTSGGVWQNTETLTVGGAFSNNLMVAGGSVFASYLIVGCNNLLQLDSGSVIVSNAITNAVLEVGGTLALNGGILLVDRFVMTNACAQFVRTGGALIYGTAVLDPNRDDDGDGIPNGWEQSYGLDPLSAADANADSDGDGFSNLQEYLAGTDPTNSASAFRILSVVRSNADVQVTWSTAGGHTNVVQAVSDLAGSYSNISANIVITGSGDTTTNYLVVGAATNAPTQFYRVRLVP